MCKSRTIMLISQGCESTMWKSTSSVPYSICRYHTAAPSNVCCHHHHLYHVVLVKGFCKTELLTCMQGFVYGCVCEIDWYIKVIIMSTTAFWKEKNRNLPFPLPNLLGKPLKRPHTKKRQWGGRAIWRHPKRKGQGHCSKYTGQPS